MNADMSSLEMENQPDLGPPVSDLPRHDRKLVARVNSFSGTRKRAANGGKNLMQLRHKGARLSPRSQHPLKAAIRFGLTAGSLSIVLLPIPLLAQGPWETAVTVLQGAFTGPIARGLSLVAIVVGGLMFAFGEGDSKRTLAGIIFGIGMAIGAVNFLSWLFPY